MNSSILSSLYDVNDHHIYFRAIAVNMQLDIEAGGVSWDVPCWEDSAPGTEVFFDEHGGWDGVVLDDAE